MVPKEGTARRAQAKDTEPSGGAPKFATVFGVRAFPVDQPQVEATREKRILSTGECRIANRQ